MALTEEQKQKVLELRKNGESMANIKKQLNISVVSIAKIIKSQEEPKEQTEEPKKQQISRIELPEKTNGHSEALDIIKEDIESLKKDLNTLFENQKEIVEYLKK